VIASDGGHVPADAHPEGHVACMLIASLIAC
jgi:hypothetical protein